MSENDIYDEILKSDADAINDYIETIYSIKVPPPSPPSKKDLSFWNIVGVEATMYSIAAVAGAVVSSIRTGGLFYILENLLLKKFNMLGTISNILSGIVLISSLLAFEGYLIAHGYAKGKEMTSAKTSNAGVISAFVVIMVAGVFSGIGLITIPPNIEQGFYIFLALITALGAGLVTLLGGKNIGYSVEKYKLEKSRILEMYQDKYNNYIAKAVKSYGTSHYSKIQKDVQSEQSTERLNQKSSNDIQSSIQSEVFSEQKIKKTELCRQAIEQFILKENRLPTITETEKMGDYSRGLISECLNKYIFENADELLNSGILTEERHVKVLNKYSNEKQSN